MRTAEQIIVDLGIYTKDSEMLSKHSDTSSISVDEVKKIVSEARKDAIAPEQVAKWKAKAEKWDKLDLEILKYYPDDDEDDDDDHFDLGDIGEAAARAFGYL